jgi:hypothetical protein
MSSRGNVPEAACRSEQARVVQYDREFIVSSKRVKVEEAPSQNRVLEASRGWPQVKEGSLSGTRESENVPGQRRAEEAAKATAHDQHPQAGVSRMQVLRSESRHENRHVHHGQKQRQHPGKSPSRRLFSPPRCLKRQGKEVCPLVNRSTEKPSLGCHLQRREECRALHLSAPARCSPGAATPVGHKSCSRKTPPKAPSRAHELQSRRGPYPQPTSEGVLSWREGMKEEC